jgi:hypothetical protein
MGRRENLARLVRKPDATPKSSIMAAQLRRLGSVDLRKVTTSSVQVTYAINALQKNAINNKQQNVLFQYSQ